MASEPVDWKLWQHLDFLWGIDAGQLVYRRVLHYMARFGGPTGRAADEVATRHMAERPPTAEPPREARRARSGQAPATRRGRRQ